MDTLNCPQAREAPDQKGLKQLLYDWINSSKKVGFSRVSSGLLSIAQWFSPANWKTLLQVAGSVAVSTPHSQKNSTVSTMVAAVIESIQVFIQQHSANNALLSQDGQSRNYFFSDTVGNTIRKVQLSLDSHCCISIAESSINIITSPAVKGSTTN